MKVPPFSPPSSPRAQSPRGSGSGGVQGSQGVSGHAPSGAPVGIEYDIKKFPMSKGASTTIIFQDDIGLSKSGKTNIYSPGYAGCLAVIVSNANGPGGLVAHISQMGNKEGVTKEAFLLETANKALQLGSEQWGKVNVVLWRGDVGKGGEGVEFPDMPQALRSGPMGKVLQNVQDVRHERDKADTFVFDTEKHVVYPVAGRLPGELHTAIENAVDELKTTSGGKFSFETSRKKMPLKLYE